MADLVSNITTVITWIMSQFTTLFNFIISKPVLLFPIGLALVGIAISIIFRVTRGLGLRSRRR